MSVDNTNKWVNIGPDVPIFNVDPNTALYVIRNIDSYSGTNFANFSDGTHASADIYCVSSASTDIDNGYIDLGMTGANFADTDFGVYGANCGYLWTATSDLYIGTGDFDEEHNANMYFFTGGIDSKDFIRMTITYDGKMGFFGHEAVAQPTGVAVTAEGIHAALISLGLITA